MAPMIKRKDDRDLLASSIRRIALGKMVTSAKSNRPLRPARVNKLVAEMDLDQIGMLVLSERDGKFYIVDGQHREKALEKWLGPGWESQQVECRVYTGLTEQQEANLFDRLNDVLTVSTYDKFTVRIAAGRPVETAILNIVEAAGLKVSAHAKNSGAGSITCVGTLVKIFLRTDGQNLAKTLAIVIEAFGDAGLLAMILSGISLVLQRYPKLKEDKAIAKLSAMRGGPSGLLAKAAVLRKQTGNDMATCVAAAAVDQIRRGTGGQKIPTWWRSQGADDAGAAAGVQP